MDPSRHRVARRTRVVRLTGKETRTNRPVLRVALSAIRSSWLVSGVFGFGLLAGGCSVGHAGAAPVPNPVIRPARFGPPGECYYVASPQECANQRAPGVPTPMPTIWLATYWPYYSSSAYFNQVPSEDDEAYAQALATVASQDGQAIVNDASDGEWVDQDGNTWEGDPGADPAAEPSADGGGDSGGDGSGDTGGDSGGDSGGDAGGDSGGGDDGGGDDG